jgi:hypothetical protein
MLALLDLARERSNSPDASHLTHCFTDGPSGQEPPRCAQRLPPRPASLFAFTGPFREGHDLLSTGELGEGGLR